MLCIWLRAHFYPHWILYFHLALNIPIISRFLLQSVALTLLFFLIFKNIDVKLQVKHFFKPPNLVISIFICKFPVACFPWPSDPDGNRFLVSVWLHPLAVLPCLLFACFPFGLDWTLMAALVACPLPLRFPPPPLHQSLFISYLSFTLSS